jgi:hypothetical protein
LRLQLSQHRGEFNGPLDRRPLLEPFWSIRLGEK